MKNGAVRYALLLLGLAAATKTLVGIISALQSAATPAAPVPAELAALQALLYGAIGLGLVLARGDARSPALGGILLVLGSVFTDRYLDDTFLRSLRFELFGPALAWHFVGSFPRLASTGQGRTTESLIVRLLTAMGAVLFALEASFLEAPPGQWVLLGAGTASAFAYAAWRARQAPIGERYRVALFLSGWLIGLLPAVIVVLVLVLQQMAGAEAAMSPRPAAFVAHAFLALIPLTTAYAIRVHHVLDVRFVLRRALQYAFARYTLLAVAALPFAALLAHLYQARERPLNELANDPGFLWLALAVGLAGVLIATRRRVFALLDRRFFREEYDAQRILSALVEKSRRAGSARELAEVINRELDAALHLESVSVYGRDPLSGHFRAPGGGLPPLAPGSAVAVLLGGSPEPLDVDLEDARSPLRRLPEVEKQWLADLGTLLLVPLLGSEGTLIGFLSLGPKKSELPFSRQDRELLGAVAAAGALTLEHRLGRDQATRRTPDGVAPTPTGPGTPSPSLSFAGDEQASDESAAECPRCGLLALPGTPACSRCGVEPRRAALPLVLLGKYAVERRIGAGGMGVVYLAVDLALGRRVAIKTLPRIAPEQAMRLRREARHMVVVSHPNLALIFGAETWHGTPALVCEYLEGGTLSDRLQHGPLPASQVVQLGLAMSDVLDRIHAAGILHRDIKPSNIGYAGDGTPKLLDFGLARIMEDTRRESPSGSGEGGHDTASVLNPTGSSVIAGTPAYVSPEVVVGQRASPGADLWALAVTLYEALVGKNPLSRESLQETVAAVRDASVPRLRSVRPDLPEGLARLLDAALASQPRLRPQSARELHEALRRIASP